MIQRPLFQLAIAALLGIWLQLCRAQENEFLPLEHRAADFASFCRFVEEEYAYFDLKKTDWAQACKFYALRIANTANRDGYVELLEQALGELYDSHAHLGTHTRSSYRLVPTQTDLFAVWKEGKAIVSDVRRSSRAESAGLLPGMEVVTIDGETIDAVVRTIVPRFLSRDDPAAREWALQVALAGRRDRGAVRLLTKTGGKLREIEFVPDHPEPGPMLTYRVIGKVGYARINNSLGQQSLVQAFDKALAEMSAVRALVIDLRDTPSGGNSTVARGIMGRFVKNLSPYQRHELVAEFRSTGIRRVWDEYASPRDAALLMPIVVLVGRWTGSMGEGLAIGLSATRSAVVLGQPMAHLLGAIGETVLPHSKIVVRVPTEKLFHINGTPREAFVPCGISRSGQNSPTQDHELRSALALALKLSAMKSNPSHRPRCDGLWPAHAAEFGR